MVVCHTTFWGITSVTAVYILIAFADYSTVKFVIEFEDSTRWALLRIFTVPSLHIRECYKNYIRLSSFHLSLGFMWLNL